MGINLGQSGGGLTKSLPNGTTATTQTLLDTSADVATDAFVAALFDPIKTALFMEDFSLSIFYTASSFAASLTFTPGSGGYVTNFDKTWVAFFSDASCSLTAVKPNPTGTFGVIQLNTSTTSTHAVTLWSSTGSNVSGWYQPANGNFKIKVRFALGSTAAVTFSTGLFDGPTGYGILLQYDTTQSDTGWMAVCKNASGTTRTALAGTLDTNWHTVTITGNGSTITYSMDGGAVTSISTDVPASQNMSPYSNITTNTTAAKSVQLDYYQYLASISR